MRIHTIEKPTQNKEKITQSEDSMSIKSRIGIVCALLAMVAMTVTAEPIHLVMWGGVPPESGPQAVCDNFNKEFADKGISIEYERYVNDDAGNLKLDTNLLGGGDIDLFMTYTPDNLAKRASSKMALDLSSLIARDKFDLVKGFGSLAPNYFIDGKPYSLPTKVDQYGFLVNKNMFDAAGIPLPKSWTYDEFRAIAKKLTSGSGNDKVYGMFFNTQQDITYSYQYLVSQNLGGDYYYKKGGKETNLTDPIIIKTLKLYTDMMLVDQSAPTHVDSVTQKLTQEGMFLSGKAAMTFGSWIIRSVKDTEKYPHDFVTALVPYPTADKTAKYTSGGLGDHLCINPKSKKIEAAWTFAKWYASKGMLPVALGGRVPSYLHFDKDAIARTIMTGAEKILDKDSLRFVLIDAKPLYAVPSITNKLPEIRKVVMENTEAVLIGKTPADQAMKEAKARADAFLK